MTTPAENVAPLGCRQCAHVVLVRLERAGRVEHRDHCDHPSGAKPMHEGCPWFAAKTEGRP